MQCGWCDLDKRPPSKVAERHRDPTTVAFVILVWIIVIDGHFLVAELCRRIDCLLLMLTCFPAVVRMSG